MLLATTWNEAIFRSDDLGASWQHLFAGLQKNDQADEFGRPHFREGCSPWTRCRRYRRRSMMLCGSGRWRGNRTTSGVT